MITFFSRVKTLGFIIILSVSSWIIIHVLTVFGFFLSIAYPIWWFFSPKQTTCLFCRSRKEGEMCPFCHQTITKNNSYQPKTFLSAVLNASVILIFSLISVGIVFLEIQLLHALGFPPLPKTVSFSIPSTGEYPLGNIFPLKLELTGINTPINAIQADISFNPKQLEVINISTSQSFANIFIQKVINNKVGYARLSGGLANPGFSGTNGEFGIIYLRGKLPGPTQVKFLPTSMVLANNGKGTDVLKDFATISYLILPKQVSQSDITIQNTLTNTNNSHTSILGASTTSDTQMIFYDPGPVTYSSVQTTNSTNILSIFLTSLQHVDNFTLEPWYKLP